MQISSTPRNELYVRENGSFFIIYYDNYSPYCRPQGVEDLGYGSTEVRDKMRTFLQNAVKLYNSIKLEMQFAEFLMKLYGDL